MITNINEFKKTLLNENITIDKIENFISGYDNALVLFFDVQEITEGDEIYEIINTIAIANDCEIHCVCNNTIVLVSNELDGDHGQLSNFKSALTLEAKNNPKLGKVLKINEKSSSIPQLFNMFTDINKDAKENGESVVKLTDQKYYADQIFNLYFEDKVKKNKSNEDELYKKAEQMAKDLAKYAKEKK